jgi:hypothetical protein
MHQGKAFGGYRRCLCAFVDVLGFRELVATSSQNEETKLKLHTILSQFQTSYHSKGVPGDRISSEPPVFVRTFSDLIVRIVPLGHVGAEDSTVEKLDLKSGIIHEIIDLCGAQFGLLETGIAVRGGMTIGDLYWDANQVFGPALVRAYDLESNFAIYPRIVLDSFVIELIRDSTSEWMSKNYVCQDFDGAWFVDYLGFYTGMLAPNIIFNKEKYHEPFEVFRSHIVQQLSSMQGFDRRRLKYLWLAKYFNRTVAAVPSEFAERWAHLCVPV